METKDVWPNNEWKVLDSFTEIKFFFPKCCPGIFYPEVEFNLKIKRQTKIFFYLIQLPLFCSIAFNLISLFIDNGQWIRFHLNQISLITLLIITIYLSLAIGIGNLAQTKLGNFK